MKIGKSSNPALGKNALTRVYNSATADASQMTINGTVNKTIISLLLVMVSAYFSWNHVNGGGNPSLMYTSGVIGFIVAIITVFKVEWSNFTTPIYSVLKGLFLGAISFFFESIFPGIVVQAIALTFGVAFTMLFAYRTGMIKATNKFKRGVIVATGGIFLVYFISFIGSLFGGGINLFEMGILGVGIQLFIVVIAALNLILDFDMIEQQSSNGAPKIMEWFGAFALMVTLIWLYFEILKLLAILSGRD